MKSFTTMTETSANTIASPIFLPSANDIGGSSPVGCCSTHADASHVCVASFQVMQVWTRGRAMAYLAPRASGSRTVNLSRECAPLLTWTMRSSAMR